MTPPFSDDDLKRLKDLAINRRWPTEIVFHGSLGDQMFSIEALLARLEAAEKAIDSAEGAIYSVYDHDKHDCPLCDNFMSPCKEWCDFPKFIKDLEAWKKASGKGEGR